MHRCACFAQESLRLQLAQLKERLSQATARTAACGGVGAARHAARPTARCANVKPEPTAGAAHGSGPAPQQKQKQASDDGLELVPPPNSTVRAPRVVHDCCTPEHTCQHTPQRTPETQAVGPPPGGQAGSAMQAPTQLAHLPVDAEPECHASPAMHAPDSVQGSIEQVRPRSSCMLPMHVALGSSAAKRLRAQDRLWQPNRRVHIGLK